MRVVTYIAAFQGDACAGVPSTSDNPDNPAGLVLPMDKGQVLSEGWVFQELPNFNTE